MTNIPQREAFCNAWKAQRSVLIRPGVFPEIHGGSSRRFLGPLPLGIAIPYPLDASATRPRRQPQRSYSSRAFWIHPSHVINSRCAFVTSLINITCIPRPTAVLQMCLTCVCVIYCVVGLFYLFFFYWCMFIYVSGRTKKAENLL